MTRQWQLLPQELSRPCGHWSLLLPGRGLPDAWGWDCPGFPPSCPAPWLSCCDGFRLRGPALLALRSTQCFPGTGEPPAPTEPWQQAPFLAKQERANCSYPPPFCFVTLCHCFNVMFSNCTETGASAELFLNPLTYTEAFQRDVKLSLPNPHFLFSAAAAVYYSKGELSFPKWVTTKSYNSEDIIWGWSCPPSSKIPHLLTRSLILCCLVESVLLDTRT